MKEPTTQLPFEPCRDTERLLCLALLRTLKIDQTSKVLSEYLELRDKADSVLTALKEI